MSSTLPMRARARSAIGLAMLLACCACGFALDPTLDVSQYAHTSWKIRDGSLKGAIFSMAQTPDGYLWLGTEFGLVRFDGVRFVNWQPPAGQSLPGGRITTLLATSDGTLWISTDEGLASWREGHVTQYPELDDELVGDLLEDRGGIVWAGGMNLKSPNGRLCAIQNGKPSCSGEDGSFGRGSVGLFQDSAGSLWVTGEKVLWRWKPGPTKMYSMPDWIIGLAEGEKGELFITMQSGMKVLADDKVKDHQLPSVGQQPTFGRIFRDRDGGMWIGTMERGLLHVHQGRTEGFSHEDGLTGNWVRAFFEDREGNIWVATRDGLDRFRELPFSTISVNQGLSLSGVSSVLAAKDGSVWIGTYGGLNRWNDGEVTVFRNQRTPPATRSSGVRLPSLVSDSGLPDNYIESLWEDNEGKVWVSTKRGLALFDHSRFTAMGDFPNGSVYSIAGQSAADVWVSAGLGLLHIQNGKITGRVPWQAFDKIFALTLLTDTSRGLYLGFFNGGVAYFKNGAVEASYAATGGLGKGHVVDLYMDRDRVLWAATQGGVSRISNGRVATLTNRNGLPCDAVHWMREDDNGAVWLYMPCGLVRIARSELDAWVADSTRVINRTLFDASDGIRTSANATSYTPNVSQSSDGKLWFAAGDGVTIIDPHHLPFNKVPPPVHIEQVVADRKTYDAASQSGSLRLPRNVRDLEIDYTALSLVAPEKTRFRYKLEGRDGDWQDAGNRRQAFYTDLPPRNYTFRVMASNNSGVWNEAGTSLDFSVAPAYYQTLWFRSLCVIAFLALLAALYQLRLRQVARMFNMRAEERVNERTRVARDLHDTLLQSFQGVLLKFHAVTYLLPDRPDEAQKNLEAVIEQARQAVTEGRDTVYGLRSSTVVTNDLAPALSTLGAQLAADPTDGNRVDFGVHVEGTPRNLSPIVRDEVYRIACEALRNAFRHACAGRIELEIRYDRRLFRLRVRDDGKGIDPKILAGDEPAGHYGLPGMHERARQVGGKLAVWSELNSGTEAELTIPASVAYKKSPAARRPLFSRRGA